MFILKKGHQPGVYVPLMALFLVFIYKKFKIIIWKAQGVPQKNEMRRQKTGFLYMRKQRRRSASR